MDVQVSREARCRERPLRAPCIRSLRDHACCAGCAFSSPLRGSLGRVARDGFKWSPVVLRRTRRLATKALCRWNADAAFKETPNKLRSEEHTSELQSLIRNSYAVFCLKK